MIFDRPSAAQQRGTRDLARGLVGKTKIVTGQECM